MVRVARRNEPRVLPGSLITLRRKCGNAGCRCATGEPHETPALSYSVGGRTKMLTLRAEDVPAVAAAVARYRTAVKALEAEARAELAALLDAVAARRAGGGDERVERRRRRIRPLPGTVRVGGGLPARLAGRRADPQRAGNPSQRRCAGAHPGALPRSSGSANRSGSAASTMRGRRCGERPVSRSGNARSSSSPADDVDVLVLSADGKGIVMRSDALRPATAKAAAKATGKLKTRLSKGEKRNRKRMAEVGAVYDVTPAVRNPTDIIGSDPHAGKPPAPTAQNKWLTASVVDDAATATHRSSARRSAETPTT